jgi:hypothetical protein
MERAYGQSILSFVIDNPEIHCNEAFARKILKAILSGVLYMH